MSEVIISLAATTALALVVIATIVRSRFAASSWRGSAAAWPPRRFQISSTVFLLSRRARQAFHEQMRVSAGVASGQAYRPSGRGTKTSGNAKVTAGERIWIVPAPAVRQPFEHVLASSHPDAASGRRQAARLDVGWRMLAGVKCHVGPFSKLRGIRHATRLFPATERASA